MAVGRSSSSSSSGGEGAEAVAARELNDLRLVFANVSGCNKFVGLKSILKLREVKAQIAEGDLHAEDLESAWLEACAVKGIASVDPDDNDGGKYHVHQRASWGVCTELSFEGFVHFLRLCEERASLPVACCTDVTAETKTSPTDVKTGHDLVAAKHRMIGLLRATLTVHQRGGGGEEEEKDRLRDLNAQLGETLHLSMVRAAVEEGLANHTPENLQELRRSGVYKESDTEAQLCWQEKKASLRLGLLSRKFSRGELVRSGILQDKTPGQLASERASAGRVLRRHHMHHNSTGSAPDLLGTTGNGAAAANGPGQHHRRPSLDDLKAQGIYRTPEQHLDDARQHKLAKALLQEELRHRADVADLKENGIYLSRAEDTKHRLEKSMLADLLNKSFRDRPFREDLMDRGVLESSGLHAAFEGLETEKGGSVKTVQDVLGCSVVAAAVKEGVVKVPALEEAFATAMKAVPSGGGSSGDNEQQQMDYEQFDKFLSSVSTTQVEEEPYSLKLWALMRMRPDLEETEHHEGNRRRNALKAKELEQELSKREPLERLANKGIYLEKTPPEGAVERAHLQHTLAHGLAHRPDLEELTHKGVYLEGVEPDDLEKSHRDARNFLEGTLSRRPELSTLQDKGYLEADELEEAFTELVLQYKHDDQGATATSSCPPSATAAAVAASSSSSSGGSSGSTAGGSGSGSCGGSSGCGLLLLPVDRLKSWAPVRKMLRSGAAIDEDVAAAAAKAQKASFHHHYHHRKGEEGRDTGDDSQAAVDFVGFLEFIHSLDIQVDGLNAATSGKVDDHDDHDPEAAAKHARRLQLRRERATHAAEQDSHGTLKEHLLAHLRARPAKDDPETQRIAKEFHSTQAVDLEKNLLKNHLEGHLRSRAVSAVASLGNIGGGGAGSCRYPSGGGGGSGGGGMRATRIKELEVAMNKRMLRLKHSRVGGSSVSGSGGGGVGAGSGVSRAAAAVAVAGGAGVGADRPLDLSATKDIVEDRLGRRASLDELMNQGIFQRTTPLQHGLERQLIEQHLSRSLRDPLRPSVKDLVDHGIYLDDARKLQMEHYLAARNLKHGLEGRETIQELKDRGIYQPENSVRAAHEKRLVKALLQRKLSRAFSKEELDRLKQKGVYKEAEHRKLEAERLLVTRQLSRLVSTRPTPEQLERQHPGLMEAGALALVFEERVMPRAMSAATATAGAVAAAGAAAAAAAAGGEGGAGVAYEEAEAETEGGPEHLVSFEGLMTWPDVQEHLAGDGGENIRHEMARHFELCDSDGDGYLSFSQFLRWVELCDLNPEDHLQVTESDLDNEYARLGGTTTKGVNLDQAVSYPPVKRWAASASLDRAALSTIWGGDGQETSEGITKDAAGFKAFCRHCEVKSSASHQMRLKDLQKSASSQEAEAKASLCAKIAAKLGSRPDLEELKKTRIYRVGGLDPAMVHLEQNLIAISLKEQLLARPAVEDLEKRGIKPRSERKVRLERNSSMLREALDSTMKHDDAQWRSHPSELAAGSREEVSAFLQKSLSKRLSLDRLTNKGVYVVDTDASYALLVHQVLRAHRGFGLSSAELVAGL